MMSVNRNLGCYLGTAFLVVWAGSVFSGALSGSILSDNPAETLENNAQSSTQMRWSTMVDLCVTSVGVVALAALLYSTLREQSPPLALVALGWWFAEAASLVVSTDATLLAR